MLRWLSMAILASSMLVGAPAHAQTVESAEIGRAERVMKVVMVQQGTQVRTIHINDPVFQDEVIRTNAESEAELVFLDESRLHVGPKSRITLDDFVYNPDSNGGNFIVQISVGSMRFVSGKLPKSGFALKTPTATIGIRGTDFDVNVDNDGTTNLYVRTGAVHFSNLAGEAVEVGPGEAATIKPTSSNGRQAPPSAPRNVGPRGGSRRADAGGRGGGPVSTGGGGGSGSGGGFIDESKTGGGGAGSGAGTGGGQVGGGQSNEGGQDGGEQKDRGFAELFRVFRYALKDRDLLDFSGVE